MELTLKRLLEQAKFTTTRKGYDQDEVDDFLDRAVAMATKVEARLTQALADAEKGGATDGTAAAPGRSDEEIQAEIAAEVDRRLQARLAEIEADAPSRPVVDDTATAEEAARTLVLAQRTADAAVAEARQEADQIRARVQEEVEEQRRSAAQQTEQERSEARARLAEEIKALEGARDGLRADVSTLEGHVEEQRLQLQSTVAELQRLLDDPAAFRLAPAPQTPDVQIPDLDDSTPSQGDLTTAGPGEGEKGGSSAGGSSVGGAIGSGPSGSITDSTAADPAGTDGTDRSGSPAAGSADVPQAGLSDSSDAPGDPDDSLDVGPPTAPVSAVDLGVGSQTDPIAVASAEARSVAGQSAPVEGDDAFLAELRKAMADEEPLGPRDVDPSGGQQGFLDDDRRGWRFGKRR